MKYSGLELPIFSSERPLLVNKKQLRSVQSTAESETFLRFVYTIGPGEQDLSERLQRTQDEFKRLEELTGKPTIPFQYGLYPIDEPKYLHLKQPYIVPDDYVLAAEVHILNNTCQWYAPRPSGILRGIYAYRSSQGELVDAGARQYVHGTLANTTIDDWFMIDIEPRLKPADYSPYSRL